MAFQKIIAGLIIYLLIFSPIYSFKGWAAHVFPNKFPLPAITRLKAPEWNDWQTSEGLLNKKKTPGEMFNKGKPPFELNGLDSSQLSPEAKEKIQKSYGKIPISFIENRGQVDPQVKYYAKQGGSTIYFTEDEIVFDFIRKKKTDGDLKGERPFLFQEKLQDRQSLEKPEFERQVVRMKMEKANQHPEILAKNKQEEIVNYIIGDDPSKWRTNVPTFSEVYYKGVYAGIDLRFYASAQGSLEYDFIVHPGGDPADIKVTMEGTKNLTITGNGDLIIATDWGEIRQKAPKIYQVIAGKEVEVSGGFYLMGEAEIKSFRTASLTYGFEVGSYDRQVALVLDPTIVYSTYLGGSSGDSGYGVAVDSSGNAYVTGETYSTNFPKVNALYPDRWGTSDAFIFKINSSGTAAVYSTYLGGSGQDRGNSIAVDGSGNAYVTGMTWSSDFPKVKALYPNLWGSTDAFIFKMNASGTAAAYSTYLGGSGQDWGYGIAVDGSGNAYVTGETNSNDFPKVNALYPNLWGTSDAFIFKMNPKGTAAVYSTYLGGSSRDWGYGIAVDASGNAYVTGMTWSADFPQVNGLYPPPGNSFVFRLNSSGNAAVYSTFIGGNDNIARAIAVDGSLNAIVTGPTYSNDFPQVNALYPNFGGNVEAFIVKISPLASLSTILSGFEISDIPSPQSVGIPFPVTINAKDGTGNIKTDFNGIVSLTSDIGAVSPNSIMLTNGTTGSFNIKVLNSGFGVYLNAQAGGIYGSSKTFTVSSSNNYGNFYGIVKDNRDQILPGAIVYLDSDNDEVPEYTETTNSKGEYNSTNKPSGIYTIWASYSGTESSKDQIYVPPYNNWNTRNLTINLFSSGKTPVIFVPGIIRTSSYQFGGWIPKLPEKYNPPASELYLHDPAGYPGWGPLITALGSGYERGVTIIGGGYDWRIPVEQVVDNYLIPIIDAAILRTGSPKVNIVAHSTGGLVVRSYIQSNRYRNDIYKFAMVATPNVGAVNAYYIWAGGDPKWADDLNDSGIGSIVNSYWETVKKLYKNTYNLGDLNFDEHTKIKQFIQSKAPELKDLMPTFGFLNYQGQNRVITSAENTNTTLKDLNNANSQFYKKASEVMSPDWDGIKVKTRVFYGNSESNTIAYHEIYNPAYTENSIYEDGTPQLYSKPFKSYGDKTVLAGSASLPCIEGWAYCINSQSVEHSNIIREMAPQIKSFIDEGEPQVFSVNKGRLTDVPTNSKFSLSVTGRVQPYILGPGGQGIGVNPTSGLLENNIIGGDLSLKAEGGMVSIENPANGSYIVTFKGPFVEDYLFDLEYSDSAKILNRGLRGFHHGNNFSFTFTIDSGSENKIAVNHTPQPTTGIQADAVEAGGLKTRINWSASNDPGVIGYNIYSKPLDEPYLTQIGTANGTAYETGHFWVTDSSVKTRIYAISAVKGDGTESFLSKTVRNDDRDHDELTDAEEIALGTNVSNPDTDGDGLLDGWEYYLGTNPKLGDTDGDGYSDYQEVLAGSDPLDPNSTPRYFLYLPIILK